jgi:hypothetical protein
LTATPGHDDLRTSRQLIVVVRLLLDADWRLQHGELVDVDETSRGRFAGWDDLTPALRRIVSEERETAAARAAN